MIAKYYGFPKLFLRDAFGTQAVQKVKRGKVWGRRRGGVGEFPA